MSKHASEQSLGHQQVTESHYVAATVEPRAGEGDSGIVREDALVGASEPRSRSRGGGPTDSRQPAREPFTPRLRRVAIDGEQPRVKVLRAARPPARRPNRRRSRTAGPRHRMA